MNTKRISILGLGWLGFPLAESLKESGFFVKGSSTSREKAGLASLKNIEAYIIDLKPGLVVEEHNQPLSGFFHSDVFIINIPFRRKFKDPSIYLEQIQTVVPYLEASTVRQVIFTSSTSVYPRESGLVRESDLFAPDNGRAEILLESEQLLMKNEHFNTVVVRFAGLYGGERKIGQFLAGTSLLPDALRPVNLIHLHDCINIIRRIIEKDISDEIFNACSDEHPTRKALYTKASKARGLEPPVFLKGNSKNFKVVENKKLKEYLNYQFIHPNPLMDFDN